MITKARDPLTCGCGAKMETLAVHSDVRGSQAVRVGKCPRCDYRHCSVKSCGCIVSDIYAKHCPAGHMLDMPGDDKR